MQNHVEAVNEAFIRLHERDLIYRGNFLVNWSCSLGSAISDIEVDHVAVERKTKIKVPGYDKPLEVGLIYDLSYKVEGTYYYTHSLCAFTRTTVSGKFPVGCGCH